MALNPLSRSNLEQRALKGLTCLYTVSLELRRLKHDLTDLYLQDHFRPRKWHRWWSFMLASPVHSTGTPGHKYKLFPHCNRASTCINISFPREEYTRGTVYQLNSDHFNRIVGFTGFIRNADLSRFVLLGYWFQLMVVHSQRRLALALHAHV